MTENSRILVTGTSSGFGKLTAITLARSGHCVFAGMRDPNVKNAATRDELTNLKIEQGGSIEVVDLDVTSDASVDAAVAHINGRAGGIDVLVNNAGINAVGFSESFTVEQARAVYEVNLFGVQRMNRAVLPMMRRGNRGLIIHISSTIGRFVLPFMGVYISSKFALEALVECYHYELAPSGIESVLIEPGAHPTKIATNMLSPGDPDRANAYPQLQPMLQGMLAMFAASGSQSNEPNPQDVADAVLRLVLMPQGSRPLRTVVDAQLSGLVDGINKQTDQVQSMVLNGMGMSLMLNPKINQAS